MRSMGVVHDILMRRDVRLGVLRYGPYSPPSELVDFDDVEIRQQGNSQDMLIPILELLVNISETFTLLPGDIVMTGTPQGVAALTENDSLTEELVGYLSVSTVVK